MDSFMAVVELPVWAVIASIPSGVALGIILLTLAFRLSGRWLWAEAKAGTNTSEGARGSSIVDRDRGDALARVEETIASLASNLPVSVVAPSVSSVPKSALREKPKPVPPIRQHYWYYVSGVSGQFATLREALSASGVDVPADKMLDWKKLSADTRAKIKRVKVGAEQPAMERERVVVHVEEVQSESTKLPEVKKESEQVIRKPIGNGAFVTIKKKGK